MRMVKLSQNEVMYFYSEHKSKDFFPYDIVITCYFADLKQMLDFFFRQLVDFMTSGPVVAIELVGPDAINRWRSMIGPTDSRKAREQGPHLLRARFGSGLNFF